jgi:hypothetical protein
VAEEQRLVVQAVEVILPNRRMFLFLRIPLGSSGSLVGSRLVLLLAFCEWFTFTGEWFTLHLPHPFAKCKFGRTTCARQSESRASTTDGAATQPDKLLFKTRATAPLVLI